MKQLNATIALVLGTLLSVNCSGSARFVQLQAYTPHSNAPNQIAILRDAEIPARPFKSTGEVSSRGKSWGLSANDYGAQMQESLNAMRNVAAEHGLDGVMNVRCASPGTVGASAAQCTGQGFVYLVDTEQ